VAVYCIFDAMNIIFCSAIKGAGDTRYVMVVTTLYSVFVLILPVYILIEFLKTGLMFAWVLATAYITALGVTFYVRFLGGKWKDMRVIEAEVTVPAPKPGPTKLGRVAKL
jgi:MATE family multidrug resistance protein